MDQPSLGSEDFSYYLLRVPGCYVRFGAKREGGKTSRCTGILKDVSVTAKIRKILRALGYNK